MNRLYCKKGITLIELIAAVAILGIIVVVFSGLFTNGFSTIFTMGSKTKAMAQAQSYMDVAYRGGGANIDTSLSSIYNDPTNFDTYEAAHPIKYRYQTQTFDYTISSTAYSNSYKRLDIRVFYQNGNRYVTLTSLIP